MAHKNIKASEIQDKLDEHLGETGSAKVANGGLYIQREENSDWQFVGSVENAKEASRAVNEYFNQ